MDTVNRMLEADCDGATKEEKLKSANDVITSAPSPLPLSLMSNFWFLTRCDQDD